MKIVGYGDRFSVQPGETVRFMVSCQVSAYRTEIVRLIHGDDNPKGPGVKFQPVAATANGRYPGRVQALHRGSFLVVPDPSALDFANGFTVQAWIRPTTPDKEKQGILTHWSESEQAGYGLFLDGDRGVSLWIGDGNGTAERLRTDTPLTPSQWYFVAATWEAGTGRVRLWQEPLTSWPLDRSGSRGGRRRQEGGRCCPLLPTPDGRVLEPARRIAGPGDRVLQRQDRRSPPLRKGAGAWSNRGPQDWRGAT